MSRQTRILNDDDQRIHNGEILKVNLELSAGNVEVWYEVKTRFRRRKTCAIIDETDILT